MFDVIVIGCGVAGMTSAIYLARAGKKVLIIEKESIGGQIASSPRVENYPGFKSISGVELANNLFEQVQSLGVDINFETVTKILDGETKKVITDECEYDCSAIIVATGCKYRLLGLPNEENLIGKGISFCVSCDGAFYKDKTVAVIGGGNTAVINALALTDICSQVYVIQNLSALTGEEVTKKALESKSNVQIFYNSTVKEIIGEDELQSVSINNNGQEINLKVDGMFISIGQIPQTELVEGMMVKDKYNYIAAEEDCYSGIDGIYVAGDCRSKKVRQLTTATNDGTIAAINTLNYLKSK